MGFFVVCIALVPFVILLAAIMNGTSTIPWGRRLAGSTTNAQPYRAAVVVRWKDAKEPRLVRVTSALTAFFGGMVFPGGLLGLFWMLMAAVVFFGGRASSGEWFIVALGASVPTGVLIGWRCLALYTPMVQNRPGLSHEMRRLSTWIIAQNVFVTATWIVGAIGMKEPGLLLPTAYNALKFVHAWLLRSCASEIDRENEASDACERALVAPSGEPVLVIEDQAAAELEALEARETTEPARARRW